MIVSMQININHCRVWLFYNEMGAVAQCPNNWGVGSAFHPKKIHILFVSLLILAMIQDQALVASKTKHLLIETETESRFEAVYLYFQ